MRRLVPLCGARAQHAVLMRMASTTLPQRAASFADGPTRSQRWTPAGLVSRSDAARAQACPPLLSQRHTPLSF